MGFKFSLESLKALLCLGSPTYGAKRIRTADPFNAIEVLYQLSYSPFFSRTPFYPQIMEFVKK